MPHYDLNAYHVHTEHAPSARTCGTPGIGGLQGPHLGMHGQRPLTAPAREGAGRVPTRLDAPDPRNPDQIMFWTEIRIANKTR